MAPSLAETAKTSVFDKLPEELMQDIMAMTPFVPTETALLMKRNLAFGYAPTYPGGNNRLIVRELIPYRGGVIHRVMRFDYNQWDAILERRRVRALALEKAMRLKRNPFRRLPSEIVKEILLMNSDKHPPRPTALLMKDVVRVEVDHDIYTTITMRIAPHARGLAYFRRCVWRPGPIHYTGRPVGIRRRKLEFDSFRSHYIRPGDLYRTINRYWDGVLDELSRDRHEFRTPQEEVEFMNLYRRAHAERDWALRNQIRIEGFLEQMD